MSPADSRARTLRAATAASLAADAATIEALEALGEIGIRPLLLKGPALAELLYDRGEERSWDDADLLVDPDREREAIAALAAIGFVPRISDPRERASVPYAVHLIRDGVAPGGPRLDSIDLHTAFAGVGAPPGSFWRSIAAKRDRLELFGRSVDVPIVPARLVLVALHAAAHGVGHRRSRRDLERAVSRLGAADWESAAKLAAEWWALDYFVAGLRLDPAGRRLLASLDLPDEPSVAARMRAAGMPRAQRSFEELARARGAGAKLQLAARKVFPSPELMRTWKPLASRGPGGLALAYLWRPPWLLWQAAAAVPAYLRARRNV